MREIVNALLYQGRTGCQWGGQVAATQDGLRPRLGDPALLGLGQDPALGQPLELQAGVVDGVGCDLQVSADAGRRRPAVRRRPALVSGWLCRPYGYRDL